ncbi:hypothetical protein LL946_08070 [Knoellia locipacati]|uniref:hypothetical protein n=1 Tax=Knoellia locipacati TaxID=882824 RepID=UPI00384ACE4F
MRSGRACGISLVTALVLAGCGSAPGDAADDDGQTFEPLPTPTSVTRTPTATPMPVGSYRTPDDKCPQEWTGLTVVTHLDEEVEYLQSIQACTTDGTKLWLRNDSEAVWVITSPMITKTPERTHGSLRGTSYRGALAQSPLSRDLPGRTVFAPDDQVVIFARPTSVSWKLDSEVNIAWLTHDIGADELESWGEGIADGALRRRNTAGSALATCTLSGFQMGRTAAEMKMPTDPVDTQTLMTQALGIGVDSSQCWSATRSVSTPGSTKTMEAGLKARLVNPTALGKAHTAMTWWQRGVRFALIVNPKG